MYRTNKVYPSKTSFKDKYKFAFLPLNFLTLSLNFSSKFELNLNKKPLSYVLSYTMARFYSYIIHAGFIHIHFLWAAAYSKYK